MRGSQEEDQQTTRKGAIIKACKFFGLPLAIVFITELVYRQNLFDQTLEQVPDMQEITKLKPMFETLTKLGQSPFHLLFYIGSFNLMPKPAALYFWCGICFVYYMTGQLKSLYGAKRPYWVSDDIASDNCSLSFGNPSGHMVNNVYFYLTLYLHLYNEVGVKYPRMSVFCTAYIVKMAATCIGVVFLIFMGFSRVYLGAHAMNQVLFGGILGGTLALIGHFNVKPLFLAMPEMLYSQEQGSKFAVTGASYAKALAFGLGLPLLFASFVLMMSSEMAFYHSNEWNYRQTRAGCTTEQLADQSNMLHYLHFQQAGAISLIAGVFCGQFFEYRFFVNTGLMNVSPWLWYRSTPVKIVLRFVITALAFGAAIHIPQVVANGVADQIEGDQVFLKALVHTTFANIIPYFLAGFVAFGLLRYFFFRAKLDNPEAQGNEFQTREEYLRAVGLELAWSGKGPSSKERGRGGKNRTGNSFDESSIEMDTI